MGAGTGTGTGAVDKATGDFEAMDPGDGAACSFFTMYGVREATGGAGSTGGDEAEEDASGYVGRHCRSGTCSTYADPYPCGNPDGRVYPPFPDGDPGGGACGGPCGVGLYAYGASGAKYPWFSGTDGCGGGGGGGGGAEFKTGVYMGTFCGA